MAENSQRSTHEVAKPEDRQGGPSANVVEGIRGGGETRISQVSQTHLSQNFFGCGFDPEMSLDRVGGMLRPKIVSPSDFRHYSVEEIHDQAAQLICNQEEIDSLLTDLVDQHILILAGQEKLGKARTAIFLASQLIGRDEMLTEILFMSLPEPDLSLDLHAIAEDSDQYGHRLLVVKDAFSLQNAALLRFGRNIDRERTRKLSERLAVSRTYIILTSDIDHLGSMERNLDAANLLRILKVPGKELLQRCLGAQIERRFPIADRSDESQEKIDQIFEQVDEILSELHTMPDVAKLVSQHLEDVLSGTISLREALQRSRDLKGWLLYDLSGELNTWCSVLALIMCCPLQFSRGVSWHEFHRFRDVVYGFIQQTLRISRRDRPLRDLLDDDKMLRRIRAEVCTQLGDADLVRFSDTTASTEFWNVLLHNCRGLLFAIVPRLNRIVEQSGPHCEVALRALGRIGELDPDEITHRKITELAKNQHQGATSLGFLLQGVLASRDQEYREDCFRHLRYMAVGHAHDRAVSAILSLREIGEINLTYAMDWLEAIVTERFAPRFSELEGLEGKLRQATGQLVEVMTEGVERRAPEHVHRGMLAALTDHILEGGSRPDGEVLQAVQRTIVGLCFGLDPIDVFSHLGSWMSRDPRQMAPLVSLLFLVHDGIAAVVGKYRRLWLPMDEENGEEVSVSCNRIVVFMAYNYDSIEIMHLFLGKILRASQLFSPIIGQYLQVRFLAVLKGWVEGNYSQRRCRQVLVRLFIALLRSRNRDLSDLIFELLNRDGGFTQPDSALAAFAQEVLEGSFSHDARSGDNGTVSA